MLRMHKKKGMIVDYCCMVVCFVYICLILYVVYSYCYVYVHCYVYILLLCLCVLIVMYALFCIFRFIVPAGILWLP